MNEYYFENAPECLAIIDRNTEIRDCNFKFRSFFGEVKNLKDLAFLDTKTRTPVSVAGFDFYFDNPPENLEVLYVNKSGFDFYFLISASPLTENNEKRLYISFKNITSLLSYSNVFEELYNSLSSKTIELDRVIREKDAANEALRNRDREMKRQLLLAQDIQKQLFPPIRTQFGIYEIASKIRPASQVSGDLVFFFERDETHADIITADITGHGIPAALITMLLRTSLQNSINEQQTPAQVLQAINDKLYGILSNSAIFVTIVYCQIDTVLKEITIFNCGHPSPFLVHSGAEPSIERKNAGGIMLGVTEELDYSQEVVSLNDGDFLIFITDGVTEAANSDGIFFEDNFYQTLSEIGKIHQDFSPVQTIRFLLEKLDEHIAFSDSTDDITMVCIKKIK